MGRSAAVPGPRRFRGGPMSRATVYSGAQTRPRISASALRRHGNDTFARGGRQLDLTKAGPRSGRRTSPNPMWLAVVLTAGLSLMAGAVIWSSLPLQSPPCCSSALTYRSLLPAGGPERGQLLVRLPPGRPSGGKTSKCGRCLLPWFFVSARAEEDQGVAGPGV
jgi:hypothetical protein